MELRNRVEEIFGGPKSELFSREEANKIADKINYEMRDVRRDTARKFHEAEIESRKIRVY